MYGLWNRGKSDSESEKHEESTNTKLIPQTVLQKIRLKNSVYINSSWSLLANIYKAQNQNPLSWKYLSFKFY